MVSFMQTQCLNCGRLEDLSRTASQTSGTWCSQCCGFTRTVNELHSNPPQHFQRTQENFSSLQEDEELIALFSKNLLLSQPQQEQPQQQSIPSQETHFQPAKPPVNFSISQHYHHYRPVAPPAQENPQPSEPKKIATPPPDLLEHLQHKAAQLRAEAYADYHRRLQDMEEQYNRQQIDHSQNPGLVGSPVSTAASINDDYQLQITLLEQERQNFQLQQEEEQMIFEQLMTEQLQQHQQQQQFLPQQENGVWTAGQSLPPKPPADPMLRTAEDFNNFYNGSRDSEMMEDEESPCVIYHSRNYRMQYHFI